MKKGNDGNRRVENGRLAYYQESTSAQFWDKVWAGYLRPTFYEPYLSGYLHYFEVPFKQFLPKNGLILEAGCGTAQWVVALRALGYRCVGLDYAVNSLQKVPQIVGPLLLAVGDLTALGLANVSFDAIISLGVVEHSQAGPQLFIDEMWRILKPGGKLLISVPHFHALRLWRAKHGAYRDNVNGLDFYQYAFTRQEFCAILENTGFKIVDISSYEHRKGIRQELKWIQASGPFLSRVFQKLSDYLPYVRKNLGHMLLVVVEKP
jgi:SAM-dependent methyltransferase